MPCRILGVWAPSSTLARNHGRTCMGSGLDKNGFRCPIQAPWGPSSGPRPPDWPKKYNPTGPRFGRTSPTCALTPRIGLPERIPAPGCGIQLQGQFSHPWGTPGRGYGPRRGHLGLAEAPNLHTDTHTFTFRWDGVYCDRGLPRPFQRPKPRPTVSYIHPASHSIPAGAPSTTLGLP